MLVGPDVVDVLIDDHREIEGLLREAQEGEPPAADEGELISVCVAELARHLVVEEEYIYPLIREVAPEGGALAADGVSDTREAEVLMRRLERSAPSDPGHGAILADLRRVMRRHVDHTEARLFPTLRRTCAPDQLGHLAGVVEMAKRTAPTRAHPAAPHNPPWNQILAPGVGLVDRIRDALTGRPTKPEDR